MSKIQVIALNDDNHPRTYVARGCHFGDAADFMKEYLLKPHTCEYEIREVYICDPQGELAKMDEDEFLFMFDLLDLTKDIEELFVKNHQKWQIRETAFDLFWENGDEWRYA